MSGFRQIAGWVLVGMLAGGSLTAQVATRDSAYLVTTSQAMLDAITQGDSAVWAPHLAQKWFQSDEEGQYVNRAEFLAGLRGLPAGQSGKLTVANVHLTGTRDVAVISYDAKEEHNFYGQLLSTTFHTTDTWTRQNGRWLQLASQVTALPRRIPGTAVETSTLDQYAGTYTLTPEISLAVARADSGLVVRRAGRPDQPLRALDDRIFVRDGVRGFWVFERDAAGRVNRVVNWRDNNAVTWSRSNN